MSRPGSSELEAEKLTVNEIKMFLLIVLKKPTFKFLKLGTLDPQATPISPHLE